MTSPSDLVFLFDVDNTLLENDRVTADLRKHLEKTVGKEETLRYFEIFEQLRNELGYADYLGALQRFRVENPHTQKLLEVSHFLLNYPFANRLYPGSLDAVETCARWGTVVILTDGDVVFQPRKIDRSGLFEAFGGNVLVYIHKEQELEAVEEAYPANHYVMIDDKVRILSAMKAKWGKRLTTVFPKQGHYALDPKIVASFPPADITLERIGELAECSLEDLRRER